MRRTVLVAAGTAVLLAGCGREATTPSAEVETFELPADQVGIGVRQVLTQDGVRSAVLVSDTAYVYEADRNLDLRGVLLTFFGEAGQEAGELTSDAGNYNMDSGHFVARGNVVLITEGPEGERRLETEQLIYDVQTDSLSTNTPFTLHEAGRVSRGESFRSDAQFRTWEVTGAQTETPVDGSGDLSF
jgi:LPS export ABC transporter protein LptC